MNQDSSNLVVMADKNEERSTFGGMEDNKIEERTFGDNKIEERTFGEIEEIEDEIEKRLIKFKNFDTKPYPPFDHRFIDYKPKHDPGSTLAEKIKKEWEVLKTHLPSSIFVRAYAERIDVMRAAITGLEGTPYCHGLFFFDIFFPSSYPARPPKIFFHSNDTDLNPHLIANDGRVSLDLLNQNCCYKWNSHKEQMWNPKQSDILQVLVTIQRQVLNGCVPSSSVSVLHTQSKKANKEIFMLNCAAMLHTLQFPPKNFEDLVRGHFRKRAHPILLIYKVQMNSNHDKTMNRFFFTLLKAFEANGAYCRHHYNTAVREEESSGHPEDKGQNTSFTVKFINKFKNIMEFYGQS